MAPPAGELRSPHLLLQSLGRIGRKISALVAPETPGVQFVDTLDVFLSRAMPDAWQQDLLAQLKQIGSWDNLLPALCGRRLRQGAAQDAARHDQRYPVVVKMGLATTASPRCAGINGAVKTISPR